MTLKWCKASNYWVFNCYIIHYDLLSKKTYSCGGLSHIGDFFEIVVNKVDFEALPSLFDPSEESRREELDIYVLIVYKESLLDVIISHLN